MAEKSGLGMVQKHVLHTTAHGNNRWRIFLPATPLLGCGAILVDFLGLGMIAPILPSIVSNAAVGNILTAQYVAVVAGQIAIGALADIIGVRRCIILVMLADAFLFGATGFTKDPTSILVLRLFAGFAAPVALGISYVAALSRTASPRRAQLNFAFIGLAFNLGTLFGAATGGLLGAEMWLAANVASGAVPLVVAIWAMLSRDAAVDAAPTGTTTTTSAAAKEPGIVVAANGVEVLDAAPAGTDAGAVRAGGAAGAPSPDDAKSRGLRKVLTASDYLAVVMSYASQGLFQGSFFSLMPVIVGGLATSTMAPAQNISSETDDDAVAAVAADAAPVIAACIMASGLLMLFFNLVVVPASIRRVGTLGHAMWCNVIGALLLAATAAVVAIADEGGTERRVTLLVAVCVCYPASYVASASMLTVLNQLAALYAKRDGAPVGVISGLSRSIFSVFFGIAPVTTIGLARVTTPWTPLVVLSALNVATAAYYATGRYAWSWVDPLRTPSGIA